MRFSRLMKFMTETLRRNKLLILALLFVLTYSCTSINLSTNRSGESPNPLTATLALVNGTLIDGKGGDPIPDSVVVIDGDRIVAVGTDVDIVPDNTQIIDVAGAAVLPGLINTHVHQAFDEDKLAAWAQAGVTTVRDLGSPDDPTQIFSFRDEIASDPLYARLIGVGPMLSTSGGYGSGFITSPENAREIVNILIEAGADQIKVAIEDDLQGRSWPMLSAQELFAIVNTAHAEGVLVSAHVSRSRHVEMALDAGVDDLAHMTIDDLSDELIASVIAAELFWVPTLEVWDCASSLHPVNYAETSIDNLRRFSQAGGKVALGTDYSGYMCEFDLGLPLTEITLMQQAGMTPMQIIVAATQNAAHVCGLGDDLGTLEQGKIADILVVNGDPLNDLSSLQDVRTVIHNGVVIRD